MPVTPTGPLSVAVDALRTLVSSIPFFQTWVGAGSQAAALASVFSGAIGWPIASIAIAGGVLTVTTREKHTILNGATVELAGASIGAQSQADIAGPQTVTGVTSNAFTAATALPDLLTIYPDQATVLPAVRPLAVVCESDDGLRLASVGTGGAYSGSGALEILLEADVSAGYLNDYTNALYEARNAYGQFCEGLMATAGTGDLMILNEISPVAGPEFTNRAEQDSANRFERWRALMKVTWGLEG